MADEKSKEEAYESERKKLKLWREILEWPAMALLIVGIVTAALDITLGGFTPIIWLVLSFGLILIIVCMEVTMIRTFLERKK
jgi:amino acid transporter